MNTNGHQNHSTFQEQNRPRPLVVVKTGRTYSDLAERHGDFEDWTARGLGISSQEVTIVDAEAGSPLPPPRTVSGAVVTGSHSMVTEPEEWVAPLAVWLRRLVECGVPILGVCYGHQLLAHALGGRVGFHPDGPEIGTREVELLQAAENDPLFDGLPKRFHAHTTHAQTVLALPQGAVLLARTEHEGHAAFRFEACAWGVQFHPEYDQEVMRHYIRKQRTTLEALGKDADLVEREVRPVETVRILRRFAALSNRRGATVTEL
jgi:GMP synthase (glutamine-hydrolysing)